MDCFVDKQSESRVCLEYAQGIDYQHNFIKICISSIDGTILCGASSSAAIEHENSGVLLFKTFMDRMEACAI